jgi:hypothetical protein
MRFTVARIFRGVDLRESFELVRTGTGFSGPLFFGKAEVPAIRWK